VQLIQIRELQAELRQALVDGSQGLVVAVVREPESGADEDLAAVHDAPSYVFTDLAFVAYLTAVSIRR